MIDDSLDLEVYPTLDPLTYLEHQALANVRNFGQVDSVVDGLVIDGGHDIGRLAIAYSRGALRLGVIEKVGKRNVEILYTTEGSIKEAQSTADMYASRLAAKSWLKEAPQAAKDHDFYVREANPATRLYPLQEVHVPQYDAVAALTKQQYMDQVVAKEEARIHAGAQKPWTAFVNFTRKSVPFAKAYVLKP